MNLFRFNKLRCGFAARQCSSKALPYRRRFLEAVPRPLGARLYILHGRGPPTAAHGTLLPLRSNPFLPRVFFLQLPPRKSRRLSFLGLLCYFGFFSSLNPLRPGVFHSPSASLNRGMSPRSFVFPSRLGFPPLVLRSGETCERNDELDATRAIAPLRPAADARIIATDGNRFEDTVDAVVSAILDAEARRAAELAAEPASTAGPPR